jgi:hypothetical protein
MNSPLADRALLAERVVDRLRDELIGRRRDERYFPILLLTLPIPVQRSQPNLAEMPAVGPQKPVLMSVKSVVIARLLYIKLNSAWLDTSLLPAAFTIPANAGEARLVPPTMNQPLPAPCTGVVSNTQAPVTGLESNDRSGTPRELPTID